MLIPDWPLGPVLPLVMDSVSDGLAPHGLQLFLHRCSKGRPVKNLWNAIAPAAVIRIGSLGESEDESLRASQIGYLLELANTELERGLVLFPGVQTGRLQAQHLASRGHRRMAYAWPADTRLEGFATARLQGVRLACAELGLDEPEVHTVSFDPKVTGDALTAWRNSGVTGIRTFNDELAIGLIHAARVQGLSVPDDMALVGVDNLLWGALSSPSLTTVAPNPEQIGRVICERVVAGLKGDVPPPPDPAGFITLIVRESS